MNVFISWSGPVSGKIATALHNWLPHVLRPAEFWLSSEDIGLGTVWLETLLAQLEQANFGIICLTSDNLNSPWIFFEAGAMAKSLNHPKVIPLLYDLEIKELPAPLSIFQAARMNKEGIHRLIVELNNELENPMPETMLNTTFDRFWPLLEETLELELANLMRQHPESVYQYLADRFGVGHGRASFECVIASDGKARVERMIDVEAYSDIPFLDTILLFPEALTENRKGGLKLHRARSLDPNREIEFESVEREAHRLSNQIVFRPPLAKQDRTSYRLTETAQNPVFVVAGATDAGGVPVEPEYFGWTVYRPTRELHLKVVFPKQHEPDEFWIEVRRASSYGFPDNPVERKEVKRLQKPEKGKASHGRSALSVVVEYPVHGFVYLLCWNPR